MPSRPRVALLGFQESDRNLLESLLTLAPLDKPAYKVVTELAQADLAIVDADDSVALQFVVAQGRVADSLLVGSPQALRMAPNGALARAVRPFDPLAVVAQLDPRAQAVARSRRAALEAQAAARAAQEARTAQRPKVTARSRLAARQTQVQDFHQSTGFSNSVLAAEDRRFDTVLVADRSEADRTLLASRLQHLGFSVVTACDGPQALGLLRGRPFEFAFIEVHLDGLDGYELCRRVRKHPLPGYRRPTVVLMNARHSPVDRIRCTLAGCDAMLGKPLDDQALIETLARFDETFQRTFEDTAPPWEPARS